MASTAVRLSNGMEFAATDTELAAFLEPDETAAALLARTFVEPFFTGLHLVDRFTSLQGGQILEIASAAGCGRTTALLQVAATCILPSTAGGVAYGGRAANVVFLDLDGKLDIIRLLEMLTAQVQAAQLAAGAVQDEMPVAHECLTRLHVVRPAGSFELLACLRSVRPLLDDLQSRPGGLACLLIDNVAAFHWLDKVARGPPAGSGHARGAALADVTADGAPLTLHRVHTAMAAELRTLQQRYRVPIIASKHVLLPGSSGARGQAAQQAQAQDAHRDTMLKPWQDHITYRLLLQVEEAAGRGDGTTRSARWQLPNDPTVLPFHLVNEGVQSV